MHAEIVWEWLDAVDQDHLDPLYQWGVPAPQQHPHELPPGPDIIPWNSGGKIDQQYNGEGNSDAASPHKSTPPSGVLLRSGNIRIIGLNSSSLAHNVENDEDPKSLVSSLSTKVASHVKSENCFQSGVPGITTTSQATHQQVDASPTYQPQSSEREGNGLPITRKRLPTSAERACARDFSGVLRPIPVVQVSAIDPVAIDCQGTRVVGGYQRNHLQTLPSEKNLSRRHTTAERAALHRSNALKGHSNVRAGSEGQGRRGRLGDR